MRLAISNIAWDVSEDSDIVELLHSFNIDAIDVAPGKYFVNPAEATDKEIRDVRTWWEERGISITGMQSLLFGCTGLNIFGPENIKNILFEKLKDVCRIGSHLGATRLVFGSPKVRDCSGLNEEQTLTEAVSFFQCLGDIAQLSGVTICLEPNPTCYGANFMTTSEETAKVVRSVNHPAIKMQLDTGAITINDESIESVLGTCSELIAHVHASEPNLVPVGDTKTDHKIFYRAMKEYIPDHVVSIEMVATSDEPHLVSIKRAISRAVECYRPAIVANS